jgi:hypothetical protein
MSGIEWRIEALCSQLADGELEGLLTGAGAGEALNRVVGLVRACEPAKISVADLDTLEDAAARASIDGLTTGVRAFDGGGLSTRLPGMGGNGPHFAWVCPQRSCTRIYLDMRAGAAPQCAISGRALERITQPG